MADTAPAPPAPSPAEPVAVRKTVTALFCDLVGSTAFGEKVDPEAARESMNRYFAMARTAIEDNGGTVAKFIGDGVMAMWGVPEVAEDDAERAVRAGLALQDAFSGIRDFIQDRHGVSLGLRVGINTGEVVISDADDDVVGDALNTAARLEAACTPGHVLVGEPTWRLSRGAVEYREHGVIQAKGKEEPVPAYEVVGFLAPEDPHTETPFVGRDAELRRLQVVMDEAILERSARLVTVIGAPGVGKTRLAREMRAAVEGGTRAFELRCEREGMATFAPVADLLRAAAGITDSHSVDEMQERLHALVEPLDDADRVAGLLAGFVGAAPMQSTEELFLAIRRLFEVLGATQPVVLVVDDIQWAEPLFIDLLEHLAEWVRDVPLMVVCLARPEIRDVRPPITEVGRRVSAVVALEGLDIAATHELAARLVGADALPADLLAKIPDSTQGNPLFVRELMRMLVDDGVIADRDGTWEMVIDVDAVEVPPTVNTLLASRVERLAVDERQALELASVVGSDFPMGAVAAAAGGGAGLDATFERLRRKELIEPTGTYWGDEPVFRFHHVLIRDAAYRRLLKGNRADLHVTIGDWTERSAADLVGEHEVTIAHHFEQAHQLRLQLGIDDDETAGLGARAAALLRTAADRALEREDLAAAGPLAARALACVRDDAEGLAELLLTACESFLGTGNVAEGTAAVDRLDAVAGDDLRLRAWIECFRAEITIYTDPGGLQSVIASADEAAEVLARLDDQAGVAKARLQRAAALVRLGRVGDCEVELDAALTAARAADDRRRVTAVLGSAPIAALWGPSPVPRAGGRCLDVVRLLRITTGSPAVEATSIRCQAVLESLRGRHDTARSMLDNARSTLEEIGHDHGLMETAYFAGLVELFADDPVAAEPHLRRAHDGLGRLGIGADAGQAAAYLARALLLQDRLDEAEDHALLSDALAGQNPQTAIVSRSVQAEILAARGEFDEALMLAAEAVHLAANTDILVDHANAVAAQARVRAAAGDTAGAAEAAATAVALYERKGAIVDVGVGAATTVDSPASSLEVPSPASTRRLETERIPDVAWGSTFDRMRAAHEHMTAGRVDEWAAMLADDFVWVERRQGVQLEAVGRDAAKATLITILRLPDTDDDTSLGPRRSDEVPPGMEMAPLDGRGRNLALAHVITYGGGTSRFEREYLLLGRIDDDGLGTLAMAFDVEDIDAATAELDRLHGEALTGSEGHEESDERATERPSADVIAGGTATIAERVSRDIADGCAVSVEEGFSRFRARMAPDAVVLLRRRGLTGDPSPDEAARWGASIAQEARQLDVEVLHTRGARLAASRFSWVTRAGFETELFHVTEVDVHGQIRRLAGYDTEADAVAALDDLAAEERRSLELRNTATMAYEAAGHPLDHVEAVRADLAALVDTGAELRYAVVRSDVAGELTIEHFAALVDAFAHLETLQLGTRQSVDLSTIGVYGAALAAYDLDRVDQLLAPEFRVDATGLPGVFSTMARDEFLAFAAAGEGTGVRERLRKQLAVADGVSCVLMVSSADGADTVTDYLALSCWRDGQVTSVHFYDIDHYDEALARFDELAAADGGPEAGTGASVAERLRSASTDRLAAGDLDGYMALVAPEAVSEDRRAGAQSVLGRDGIRDSVKAMIDLDAVPEYTTIATRLELVAAHYRFHNVAAGFEIDTYAVTEVDAGRQLQVRTVFVDTEAEALAVMDELLAADRRRCEVENGASRLWRAAGRPFVEIVAVRADDRAIVEVADGDNPFIVVQAAPDGSLTEAGFTTYPAAEARIMQLASASFEGIDLDLVVRYATAANTRVRDDLEACLSPSFTSRTRGDLALPDGSREEWIDYLIAGREFGMEERQRKVFAVANGAICSWSHSRTENAAATYDVISVLGWDHTGITVHDQYPLDALDDALARFDELAGVHQPAGKLDSDETVDSTSVPLNTAALAALRNNRALFDQPGEEAWLATFADVVVVEDRQRMAKRTLRGKEEIRGDYISVSQRATKFGFDVETEILGVRDDNLAITLMRVFESDADGRTDADVFLDHIAIYRTDDAGLIDRCAMFDVADESDAWEVLGLWWADSMPNPDRLLMRDEVRQGRLFREFRYDEWREGHNPAYSSTDHRPLGFGSTDGAGMAQRNAALTADIEGGTVRFPIFENLGFGVRVATIEADLVRTGGAEVRIEISYVSVTDLANGGTIRNDQFALDDIDAARALGRQLAAEQRQTVAMTEALVVGGIASSRARQSLDLFTEMLADDFLATRHDGNTVDRAAIEQGDVRPANLGFGYVDRSLLCNIDRVGLFHVRDDESEWFSLEVCSDDRLVTVRQFAISDPRSALRAFDDVWPDQYAGTELHQAALTGTQLRQAMASRDAESLDEILAENFVVSDNRTLMYGELQRHEYLEAIRELSALANPEVVGEALGFTPNGWLWRGRQLIPDEGFGASSNAGVFIIGFDAGRITRLEAFDEDDLDTAIARFEELANEPEVHSFAHAEALDWVESARRGDVAAIVERHLSEELVASETVWGGRFELDFDGFSQNLEALFVDVEELVVSFVAHRGPRLLAMHFHLVCGGSQRRWVDAFEFDATGRALRLVSGGSATLAGEQLDRWLEEQQRSLDLRNSATVFYEATGEPFVEISAVRGDDTAIIEVGGDLPFVVVTVDDFGELTTRGFESYEQAADHARTTHDARSGVRVRPAFGAFRSAVAAADRDALEASLAPDFVLESFGDLDVIPSARADVIEWVLTSPEFSIEQRSIKTLAWSESCVCYLGRTLDAGNATSIDRVNVLAADDRGVTYNGIWPVEMADDALTVFDELTAAASERTTDPEAPAGASVHQGSEDPSSAMTKVARAAAMVAEAIAAGDLDRFAALIADDLDFANHRALSNTAGGKAELLENVRSQGEWNWEYEPIAAASDHAAVFRIRAVLPGENELEWCSLIAVGDDGLINRWHGWDLTDLRLAFAAATAWLPQDMAPAVLEAMNRGDRDALAARVSADFRFRDHRQGSVLGELDASGWIELQGESIELLPTAATWTSILEMRDGTALVEFTRWSDPAGAADWQFLGIVGVEDSRLRALDVYSVDDRDAARACFEELAATQ